MPRMNGFEFLEKYQEMFTDLPHSVIVMLTTSINSIDKEKSKKYNIQDFVNKPLTVYWLQSIDDKMNEK